MTGLAVGTTQGTAKATADGAALLEVRGLGIALPDGAGQMQRIVHDVSLTVGRGQRVALVGESGSGKTLTAHALMRLTEGAKYDGQILFEGQDVLTAHPAYLARWPDGHGVSGAHVGTESAAHHR